MKMDETEFYCDEADEWYWMAVDSIRVLDACENADKIKIFQMKPCPHCGTLHDRIEVAPRSR